MPRSVDVTRFIILSQPRTGSTLLRAALDRHPGVWCYRELMNPADGGKRFPRQSGRARLQRAYLAAKANCVGFKLQTDQPPPLQQNWEDAWDWLAQQSQLKVILLYRRDVLAQLASERIAEHYRAWQTQPQQDRPVLRITADELIQYHTKRRQQWRNRLNRFPVQPRLVLAYEDLNCCWERSLQSCQYFLGANPRPIDQPMAKQEHRPLSQVIDGYAALRAAADTLPPTLPPEAWE